MSKVPQYSNEPTEPPSGFFRVKILPTSPLAWELGSIIEVDGSSRMVAYGTPEKRVLQIGGRFLLISVKSSNYRVSTGKWILECFSLAKKVKCTLFWERVHNPNVGVHCSCYDKYIYLAEAVMYQLTPTPNMVATDTVPSDTVPDTSMTSVASILSTLVKGGRN